MKGANRGDDPPTLERFAEMDDLAFFQTAVLLTSVRSFRSFVRLFVSHGNRASFPSPPLFENASRCLKCFPSLFWRPENELAPWHSADDDDQLKKSHFGAWSTACFVIC